MRRAAIRFESAGQYGEAAHWYVNAGDEAAAATLLARGGFVRAAVLGQPLTTATLRSLAHSSEQDCGPTASAEVGRLLAELSLLPPRQGQEHLAEWSRANEVADHDLSVTVGVAQVLTARRSGDWYAMASAARAVIGQLPEGASWPPGLRAWLLFAGASAESWLGHDGTAALEEALREAEADDVTEVRLEILGMLALLHARAARVAHADRAIDEAFSCVAERGELSPPITLDLAIARRGYLAADFDSMSRAVGRVIAIGSPVDDAGLAAMVTLTRAELLVARGQVGEARGILHAEAALGPDAVGVPAVARDAMLADIETSLGRPNAALTLLDPHRGGPLWDQLAAPRARTLMRAGEIRAAGEAVRGALTASSSGLSRYDVVEAMLCEAQVELMAGDDTRAIELLMQVTEIAGGDIVLPFVRVADVFAEVVSRHVTLAAVWPLRDMQASVEPEPDSGKPLADPLTDRERTVLRYLGTNMSTAEIAAELFVSVNTVKTHLAAIYRKLAASRRREAVTRARELELL
jgi:LuxR family maltose regulon positive regulatory protein